MSCPICGSRVSVDQWGQAELVKGPQRDAIDPQVVGSGLVGALIGGAVAGPPGAVIGAVLGALFGSGSQQSRG